MTRYSILPTHFVVPGPVSIFQPSSSFIIADMKSLHLEIQLAPVMQLYIVASTEEKGKMSGECKKKKNHFGKERLQTLNVWNIFFFLICSI